MVQIIMPMIFIVFIISIIVIGLSAAKTKKIKINETISAEYQQKAIEIIKNNPNIPAARTKYKLLSFIRSVSMILFMVLIVLVFNFRHSPLYIIGTILSFVVLIVTSIFRKSKVLYAEIIPEVINSYRSGLKYEFDKGIPSNIYGEAKFERWDRYHSEDLITGQICDCNFTMSEVHTEDRYTDSEGRTHYRTIFRGTFAVIDLNKSFDGWLNIVNNKIKLFSRDNYISLENTEFEKIYDVFTDDKIKSMRLLTPDVTTKMIDLYNETGLYCEIKILNNKMYIRLYTSGLFELGFSNQEKEAKKIGQCIAVIDSVFKVTENFITELERFDD